MRSPDPRLDVATTEKTRTTRRERLICPNPLLFYKIKGLLPSVDSRKQVPSDS
jgi:hypothetical protein